jgi:hypothetical protein
VNLKRRSRLTPKRPSQVTPNTARELMNTTRPQADIIHVDFRSLLITLSTFKSLGMYPRCVIYESELTGYSNRMSSGLGHVIPSTAVLSPNSCHNSFFRSRSRCQSCQCCQSKLGVYPLIRLTAQLALSMDNIHRRTFGWHR